MGRYRLGSFLKEAPVEGTRRTQGELWGEAGGAEVSPKGSGDLAGCLGDPEEQFPMQGLEDNKVAAKRYIHVLSLRTCDLICKCN